MLRKKKDFKNNRMQPQIQKVSNFYIFPNYRQVSFLNWRSNFPQASNFFVLSHQRHLEYARIVNRKIANGTKNVSFLQNPFVPQSGLVILDSFSQQKNSKEGYLNQYSQQYLEFKTDQKIRSCNIPRNQLQKWQFQHGIQFRRENPQLNEEHVIYVQRYPRLTEQLSNEIVTVPYEECEEDTVNMVSIDDECRGVHSKKAMDISYYQPIPQNKYDFAPEISSQNSSQSNLLQELVEEENSDTSEQSDPSPNLQTRNRTTTFYDYYDEEHYDDDDEDSDDQEYEDEMDEEEIEFLLENARLLGIPENLILSDRDFESTDYEALLMLEKCNVNIGATNQQIAQLPTTLVTNQSNLKEEQCTICMEGFCDGNVAKNLPCGHVYHAECINTWLAQKPLCPVCGLDWKEFLQNQR
eukprot:TRINITY_DN4686_c0_g1_i3.p1 TRINITY_DN4686_c0_g1~~TRINITY_DN4686_c0_g1_i3.p1  ORF type:complete len:410 (+),score=33.22 TRINITY_DN4686_c0_g1_i3:309-1538(+)